MWEMSKERLSGLGEKCLNGLKLRKKSIVLSWFLLTFFIVPAYASNYYDGKVTWAASRDSNWEIYIMNEDGSAQTRLTFNLVVDQHPVFTPDGNKIVWSSDFDIWIMNPDGSNQQPLTSTKQDNHPWVSQSGKIYFNRLFNNIGQNQREIWRMNLDGSAQEKVIGDALVNRWHPSVRSDELIVYAADISNPKDNKGDEVRTYNPNTEVETTIYAPGWHVSAASWDPTGTKIILSEDPNMDGIHQIVVIDTNGNKLQTLTDNTYHDFTPYYKYPTGTRIDYVRKLSDLNTEIFRMESDGSNQVDLTNHPTPDLKVVESGSCSPSVPAHPHLDSWGVCCDPVWGKKDLFYFNSSNTAPIYATGHYFAPNQVYPLYIVQDRLWNHGDTISPVVTTTVSTDSSGNIQPQLVWNSNTAGKYDMIVDIDNDGKFDSGSDALDDYNVGSAGFEVIYDAIPPSVYPLYSTDNNVIGHLRVSDLVNAEITVEGFLPTTITKDYDIYPPKQTVTYTRKKINLYKPASYRITAKDEAGNVASACPLSIELTLETGKPVTYSGTLSSKESKFLIKNNGVRSIQITINNKMFRLIGSSNKLGREGDTYFIPEYGEYNIDISQYLALGPDDSSLTLEAHGKPGGSAEILISE
ncbi:MAG: hypothetical protein OIN66_04025 [Candidatus Methanoperedens sp.]|nr:hypothetical protein [Candidatus Methanoperedens sp.]